MTLFLAAVFVASLTGSLHCAGMCGPFALMAGLCGDRCDGVAGRTAAGRWIPVAGYHAGRMVSYLLVGLLAGWLGAAVELGGNLAGWQQAATWLAGMMMVAMGGMALLRQAGWISLRSGTGSWVAGRLQPWMRRVVKLPPAWRALGIGVLTVLMPCGWLYVFAVAAAGTGSPLLGGLTMLVFWSGTVPVLLALVLGVGGFAARARLNLPAVTAVLTVCLGIHTTIWRAPVLHGQAFPVPVAASLDEAAEAIRGLDHGELPCCRSGE